MTKPRRRKDPEHDFQKAQVIYLTAALRGLDSFFFAIPNGGSRARREYQRTDGSTATYSPEGQRLRAEGVKAGVADIHIYFKRADGSLVVIWLENKAGKNTLSEKQKEWGVAAEELGVFFFVCRTLEDTHNALVQAGVPVRARPSARPHQTFEVVSKP